MWNGQARRHSGVKPNKNEPHTLLSKLRLFDSISYHCYLFYESNDTRANMFDCVSIVSDQTPQSTIHTNRLENHI